MINYTFEEHVHNYAVWTSARAVSRDFTTTANIKKAVESSGLRSFVNNPQSISSLELDIHHKIWANQLIEFLHFVVGEKATYGRAAKIISIYLKTSVILCNRGVCDRSEVIHPPIDAILLNSIAKKRNMPELTKERWTQLDEESYWRLVTKLRAAIGSFDWRLEYFWKPDRD